MWIRRDYLTQVRDDRDANRAREPGWGTEDLHTQVPHLLEFAQLGRSRAGEGRVTSGLSGQRFTVEPWR